MEPAVAARIAADSCGPGEDRTAAYNRAYGRAYRQANREEYRSYMREYYRANSNRQPMVPGATRQSKTCPACGVTKDRGEYYVVKSGTRKGHLFARCRDCQLARIKEGHKRDPSAYRRIERKSKLKAAYGITPEDYSRMLKEQGGGCAVCKTTEPSRGRRGTISFAVDHDHVTGKVRGLLCASCNRAAGLIYDSPSLAKNLAVYLENNK